MPRAQSTARAVRFSRYRTAHGASPARTVRDWRGGRLPLHPSWLAALRRARSPQHLPLPNRHYAYLLRSVPGRRLRVPALTGAACGACGSPRTARYPGIIGECCLERSKRSSRGSGRTGYSVTSLGRCVVVSMYSKHWPCLFPQHGVRGRKHRRAIQFWRTWQHGRSLRAHGVSGSSARPDPQRRLSDRRARTASRARVRRCRPGIIFSNRSEDVKSAVLRELRRPRDSGGPAQATREVAIYRLASVARMDRFVGPKTYAAGRPWRRTFARPRSNL